MRYKIYTDDHNRIIAASTYAGRTVRGYAKCAPGDIFNREVGEKLAIARCDAKIARKRRNNAWRRYKEAQDLLADVQAYCNDMEKYYHDSYDAMMEADNNLLNILETV